MECLGPHGVKGSLEVPKRAVPQGGAGWNPFALPASVVSLGHRFFIRRGGAKPREFQRVSQLKEKTNFFVEI